MQEMVTTGDGFKIHAYSHSYTLSGYINKIYDRCIEKLDLLIFFGWNVEEVDLAFELATPRQFWILRHGTPKQKRKWRAALRRKASIQLKRAHQAR